ncbi:hypothetical protein D3C72_1361170 [compost metagenome]
MSVSAEAFDTYKTFHRDSWDFEANTQYFSSTKNFNSSGKSESLPSGNTYSLWDTTLETRYTPRRTYSIFGSLNIANSQAKDSVATRKNSSITDALLGMDFFMYSGTVDLIPEATIDIPFQAIDAEADDALNSEGVMQVSGRMNVQKDLRPLKLYGYLGFTYRGDGRSFLLPWGSGFEYKATRRWLFGAELFGYQSMTDDKDTGDELNRNSHINTVNAGSMAFYSVNPDVIDSKVFLQYRITRPLTFGFDAGMTLAGKNMADGYHIGGFFRYTFDLTEGYVQPPPTPTPAPSPVPSSRSNMYKSSDQIGAETDTKKFKATPQAPKVTRKPKPAQQMAPVEDFTVQLKGPTKKTKPQRRKSAY